ncbi:MAG: signal peptidase I [Methylobacteriaceae bacterium]|nr:signal peptidase I [Methylobacteriaceae bacterium]MBV9218620.1 signal peptidase I [Methylobacteriaceae bacterium]MBV9702397.1 signal peptidase I [Methylobacteriaceae bacterium]
MTEPTRIAPKKLDASRARAKEGGIGEVAKIVFQALLVAIIIRTLLFQPFNIPSGSLIPTLLVGDYVFVAKYAYGYSSDSLFDALPFSPHLFSGRIFGSLPKVGDVVVFKVPTDNSTDFIKRVIGLPGDRIQMIRGDLYINGEKVKRELVSESDEEVATGLTHPVKRYRETLPNGVTHIIQTVDDGFGELNNTGVFTVPAGHVFMMGDNRDLSADSRIGFGTHDDAFDYVPLDNLIGRAERVFFSIKTKPGEPNETESAWSFWRWPWTLRWDRLLQPVT